MSPTAWADMSTSAPRRESEFSAGGVVVRGGQVITIVPVKRAADGRRVLGLPKGHPDGDETPEQAATREIAEEAGVQAELVEDLGDVDYVYARSGREIRKVVRFFLFDYRSGDLADHDHEIEVARWMDLSAAARQLTYEGERAVVARAISRGATER
jgi:8-oxo-dGTP pyrophosphatase MutT (NUDIX family)